MLVIGIDPGISGSICFFQDGKIIDVVEMPTMTDGKKNKKQVNGSQIFNEISERIKKIDKKHRIDFWIGIGIGTWTTAILMTIAGYLAADYLNKDMLIGLAIVNPVYFFCMMIGAMKNLSISVAVVLGTILGPLIYLVSTEWALLFAGLIAGTIAFLFGGQNGK